MNSKHNQYRNQLIGFVLLYLFLCVNIVMADSLLLHRNVMDDPYIPRLTKQEMLSRLEAELFDFPTASSLSYFFDNGDFRPVTFATDLGWDRLCYHDRYWEWIKAYGEAEAVTEHNLFCPIDVCSNNGNGPDGSNTAYVFVLESGRYHNRILRLKYYHPDILLSFEDSLTIDSDIREGYAHLCLNDNGTIGNVSDDYVWVIDQYYSKLDKYNAFGAQGIQSTHTLIQGWGVGEFGSFGDIACGRNVGSGENNDYLYVLDGARQRVVRLYDNGVNLIYDLYYEFSNVTGLSGIAVDVYGQVYVTDMYNGRICKFTPSLEMLGIYDPGTSAPNGLVYPTSINNAMGTPNNPGWADLFICEDYSDTTGGQWYQIGVELIDQQNPEFPTAHQIEIPYSASDAHALYAGIYSWSYDLQEWEYVDTICGDYSVTYSGNSVLQWSVLDPGISKLYKIQVTGQSTYQNNDGDPIDEFSFEVQKTFGNEDPHFFDDIHIESVTDCILYGDGGAVFKTLKSCALDSDPPVDLLLYRYTCSEGSFSYYGSGIDEDDVIRTENVWANINWYPPIEGSGATSVTFDVTVYDQKGGAVTSQVTYDLASYCGGDDPECPTLYVWTEKGYEIDNNVLSASEDTAQAPGFLDDNYLLQWNPSIDENGYIHLQLREDEDQTTTFDGLKLTVAWVEEGREIGISDRGTVFYPIQVKTPMTITDGLGTDRLPLLDTKDGESFSSSRPGELIINFGKIRKSSLSASIFAESEGGPGLPPPDKNMDKLTPDANLLAGNILRVDVVDETGEWVKAGIVPPRKMPSFNYIDLGDWVVEDEDLWVRLRWDYAYSIDYLAYYEFDETGIERQEFKPAVVSHSSLGDIREALLAEGDEETTTLHPGETITLLFGPIPEALEGIIARYILTCTGRYTTDETGLSADPTAPDSTSLDQNTPNPFNEGTTIFYSLSADGQVELDIYNILGQRVTTLISEFQPAGQHQIRWNGCDRNGKQAASGIYFYRLTTGKFAQSRKMILMK